VGDASCGPGATCDAQGHCVPQPCSASAACPANLVCSPTDDYCVRKACTSHADCNGYCLAGFCAEKPGSCGDCT
jgi:hypothetical protein